MNALIEISFIRDIILLVDRDEIKTLLGEMRAVHEGGLLFFERWRSVTRKECMLNKCMLPLSYTKTLLILRHQDLPKCQHTSHYTMSHPKRMKSSHNYCSIHKEVRNAIIIQTTWTINDCTSLLHKYKIIILPAAYLCSTFHYSRATRTHLHVHLLAKLLS